MNVYFYALVKAFTASINVYGVFWAYGLWSQEVEEGLQG